MEEKQYPLMKVTCMNQNCLFGFETNHPEYNENKVCSACGNIELKVTKVVKD